MNHITLTGNAVRDLEMKYTPSGKEVCSGTIAVKKNFKNAEGKYDSDFVDFVCWGKKAEVLANYVRKGDKFGISGRLQTRTYQNQEGKNVKVVEVNVEDFDLPSKQSSNQSNNQQRQSEDPFQGTPVDDQDLPF